MVPLRYRVADQRRDRPSCSATSSRAA